MIHFLAIHPFVALLIVVFVGLLVALFVGGLLKTAATHDMPPMIEPGDLNEPQVSVSAAVELASMGFDVKSFGPQLQITDCEGITFYMPKGASLKQCLDRYREKLNQFYAA